MRERLLFAAKPLPLSRWQHCTKEVKIEHTIAALGEKKKIIEVKI